MSSIFMKSGLMNGFYHKIAPSILFPINYRPSIPMLQSIKNYCEIRIRSQEEKDAEEYKKKAEQKGLTSKEIADDLFFGRFRSSKQISPELYAIHKSTSGYFPWHDPIGAIKSAIKISKKYSLYASQKYDDKRTAVLGFDLAAAFYIIHSTGKVKFKGIPEWVTLCSETKTPSINLPNNYDTNYILEEIDLSNLPIVFDALLSFENLYELKVAKFSKCEYFDDWYIDRFCDQNYNKLEHLDISYCPLVTETGLLQLSKLRNLKSINVTGLKHVSNLKLICLLLEECLPGLEIIGVSFDEEKQNVEQVPSQI